MHPVLDSRLFVLGKLVAGKALYRVRGMVTDYLLFIFNSEVAHSLMVGRNVLKAHMVAWS